MTTKVPDTMLEGGEPPDPSEGGSVPPGTVLLFAGANAPSGWLLCHGQAVSRADNAELFDAIGTAFGVGNGSTTFNVPDLRGRLPLGKDNMGGTPANRVTNAVSSIQATNLGAAGGDQRLQQHSHGVSDPGHSHGYVRNVTQQSVDGSGENFALTAAATSGSTGSSTTGVSVQNAGSGSSQNMPPVLVLNYIIKGG